MPTPREPNTHDFTEPAVVNEALHCAALVPPPAQATIGDGSLAGLRAAMARFRSGDAHTDPRRAVERAVDRIDIERLTGFATERARAALVSPDVDGLIFARRVPTEALALAMGCDEAAIDDVVGQAAAVVEVIGRGAATSSAAEAGCDALLTRFADHPDGATAAASLLYQVVDATAALLLATLTTGPADIRSSALSGTVRVATDEATIDGITLTPGDTVRLRFADATLEFGAGPHACPGADLARAIVAAVVAAVAEAGYRPDGGEPSIDSDGVKLVRPASGQESE